MGFALLGAVPDSRSDKKISGTKFTGPNQRTDEPAAKSCNTISPGQASPFVSMEQQADGVLKTEKLA